MNHRAISGSASARVHTATSSINPAKYCIVPLPGLGMHPMRSGAVCGAIVSRVLR